MLYHLISKFLCGSRTIPLPVIFMYGMNIVVLIRRKCCVLLHLLCAEDTVDMMHFLSPS